MSNTDTELVTACCGETPVRRYMDTPGCPGCNQWDAAVERRPRDTETYQEKDNGN